MVKMVWNHYLNEISVTGCHCLHVVWQDLMICILNVFVAFLHSLLSKCFCAMLIMIELVFKEYIILNRNYEFENWCNEHFRKAQLWQFSHLQEWGFHGKPAKETVQRHLLSGWLTLEHSPGLGYFPQFSGKGAWNLLHFSLHHIIRWNKLDMWP